MKNYRHLFENTNGTVPTFIFNCCNDGRDVLNFMMIDDINDEYVVLKNSISTLKLEYSKLHLETIILENNFEFTIVCHKEYSDYRFIPVENPMNNKYLMGLFEKANIEKLLQMFN